MLEWFIFTMTFEQPHNKGNQENNKASYGVRFEALSRRPELVRAAAAKAEALIARESVDLSDFIDVYEQKEIVADLRRVENLEAKWAGRRENTQPGDVLLEQASLAAEALVYQEIALGGWFAVPGVKVYVEKTSRPDDVLHKVDLVLTFVSESDTEPFAITVDVTAGPGTLMEKVLSIKQEIDEGRLSMVKYHQTLDGEHGSFDAVPRAVLGIDPTELAALLDLWVHASPENKERLHAHPIQRLFVEEIFVQLRQYHHYAVAKKMGDKIIGRLDSALTTFATIRSAKEKALGPIKKESHIEMLAAIQRVLGVLEHKPVSTTAPQLSTEDRWRRNIVRRLRP